MKGIKKPSAFTEPGKKALSLIIKKIIEYHAHGDSRQFAKILRESMQSRGLIGEGRIFAKPIDDSTLFRLANVGKEGGFKSVNPRYFQCLTPFVRLTEEEFYNIGKGLIQSPVLSIDSFTRLDEVEPGKDKSKYVFLSTDESNQVIGVLSCNTSVHRLVKEVAMQTISRGALSRLSIIFLYSTKEQGINPMPYLPSSVIYWATTDSWFGTDGSDRQSELSLSEEVLQAFAAICFKSDWHNSSFTAKQMPYSQVGGWKEMLADLEKTNQDSLVYQ
jgi:hypothetical protein